LLLLYSLLFEGEIRALMQVRIVGAHQAETSQLRFTTLLIDERLVIDAGSLASGLSLAEQLAVENVLLTHQHWDHVKDLGAFGYNLFGAGQAVTVYCTDEVREVISRQLFPSGFWMDFFTGPLAGQPVFLHRRVAPGGVLAVGGYRVLPITVPHTVPTLGYQVTDAAGRRVLYSGDNGPGCGAYWAVAEPHVLITECTMPTAMTEDAAAHGHLSPATLEEALAVFLRQRGYLPHVVVVHLNPFHEDQIRAELGDVARRLGCVIDVGREGMALTV